MLKQKKEFKFEVLRSSTIWLSCKTERCQRKILVKRKGLNREFGKLCRKCTENLFDTIQVQKSQ